jgi:hypothetical protein
MVVLETHGTFPSKLHTTLKVENIPDFHGDKRDKPHQTNIYGV